MFAVRLLRKRFDIYAASKTGCLRICRFHVYEQQGGENACELWSEALPSITLIIACSPLMLLCATPVSQLSMQIMANHALFISGQFTTPARCVLHLVWLRSAIGWQNSSGNTNRILARSNRSFMYKAIRPRSSWERREAPPFLLPQKTDCQFLNIHRDESNNPPWDAAAPEKIRWPSWCAPFSGLTETPGPRCRRCACDWVDAPALAGSREPGCPWSNTDMNAAVVDLRVRWLGRMEFQRALALEKKLCRKSVRTLQ